MSRHKCSVNCSSYVATSDSCHDLIVHCTEFNFVVTSKGCCDCKSSSSSICCCLTWSFCRAQLFLPSITLLLRLGFCGHDLNMNLHCCQGFMTSDSLILVRLSCCKLLQPVISVILIHLLLLLLQKFLFLLNSLLHNSLVSYSIFLNINQSF